MHSTGRVKVKNFKVVKLLSTLHVPKRWQNQVGAFVQVSEKLYNWVSFEV